MKKESLIRCLVVLLLFLLLGLLTQSAYATTIVEFSSGLSTSLGILGIAATPDGDIWFTEPNNGKIARFDDEAQAISEIPVGGFPVQITLGPDGALWFADRDNNRVGRCDLGRRECSGSFYAPTSSSGLLGISFGPDGNIWFVENWADKIGRINLMPGDHYGEIIEFPLPPHCTPNSACSPYGITGGPDGNIWFAEQGSDKIGKISPTGVITEYSLPSCGLYGCRPAMIISGPDGMLWFTEQYGNRIGKITTDGILTEYSLPSDCGGKMLGCQPFGITVGLDGNIWFTEQEDRIGTITPDGIFSEVYLRIKSGANLITSGKDGNLYFTEYVPDGKLGRVSLAADLSVGQTAIPSPVISGDVLNLTIDVQNNGPEDVTELRVIDALTANLQFVSATTPPNWSCQTPPVGNAGTITCSNALMKNGNKSNLVFRVRVSAEAPNSVSNTVTVSSAVPDLNPTNNSLTLVISVIRPTPTPVRIFLPLITR